MYGVRMYTRMDVWMYTYLEARIYLCMDASPRSIQSRTAAIPLHLFRWTVLQLSWNMQRHLSHGSLAKGPLRLIPFGAVICITEFPRQSTVSGLYLRMWMVGTSIPPGSSCGYAWGKSCVDRLHWVAWNQRSPPLSSWPRRHIPGEWLMPRRQQRYRNHARLKQPFKKPIRRAARCSSRSMSPLPSICLLWKTIGACIHAGGHRRSSSAMVVYLTDLQNVCHVVTCEEDSPQNCW